MNLMLNSNFRNFNMKRIVLLLINIFWFFTLSAQVFINPSCKSISDDAYRIKEIKKNNDQLVFIFEFNSSKKGKISKSYFNISESLYLIDNHTGEKYYISEKWGVEYKPRKTKFSYGQKIEFELTFNNVSEKSTYLDLVDDKNLEIKGISVFFDLKLTITAISKTGDYLENAVASIYDGNKLISEETTDDIGEVYFKNSELEGNKKYRIELKKDGILIWNNLLSTFDVLANEELYLDINLNKNNNNKVTSTSYPQDVSKNSVQKSITTKDDKCNEIRVISKSTKPSFGNYLTGVKHAVISRNPDNYQDRKAFNALSSYLKGMGFESVEYYKEDYHLEDNLCEYVFVGIYYEHVFGVSFYNIKLEFLSPCTGYKWQFSTSKKAKDNEYTNATKQFHKVLLGMYGYKKTNFNSQYTLRTNKKLTCWTEGRLKKDFEVNGIDVMEGIYENSNNNEAKHRLALKKIENTYYLLYLSGARNPLNWEEGEIKATLIPTATSYFFKAKWIYDFKDGLINVDTDLTEDFYVSFENGMMTVLDSDKEKSMYIKMYPTASDNIISSSRSAAGSGSGFAITSNGLIVTNHHVIDGAQSIKIRGVNGDFSQAYTAKLLIQDKNNDLAILKIDDYRFSSLGNVPYTIKTRTSSAGESIFVLGYPLTSTMGDDIKLTNGIISSKSGYQSDVTAYQVSAPVQPGNSGGPLFNNKGELIGIVNAKHTGAQNASYAIKSSYLMNLIELMEYPPTLQKISIVSGKSLPQQVKIINKFVYLIEVEY